MNKNHTSPRNSQPRTTQPAPQRQHQRGAWGLSLVIHLAALLLAGLIWQSLPQPGPSKTIRTGGIVLAQDQGSQETEYFDEQDLAAVAQGSSSAQPSNSSDNLQAQNPDSAVNESAVSLANLQLPGQERSRTSPSQVALGDPLATTKLSSQLPADRVSETFLEAERKRLQARKPVGPVGKVSLFGSEAAEGRSFVFVIDRSKSMGGQGLNALVAAQQQLQVALAGLLETHRFQIVAYNDKRVYFHPKVMVRVTQGNEARINEFFGNLLAVGGTDHEMAVLSGLRFKPDALFLLTDGGHPDLTAGQLTQIRKRAAGRTTIHTIQFGLGPLSGDTNFMQRLAQQNGGHFHYVNVRP